MSLSSEEQIAVAMHLASSGAKASDIEKQLKKVCGSTTLPESALKKHIEKEKNDNVTKEPPKPPTVKRILTKKMKMVKEDGCWKPVFVDIKGAEEEQEK